MSHEAKCGRKISKLVVNNVTVSHFRVISVTLAHSEGKRNEINSYIIYIHVGAYHSHLQVQQIIICGIMNKILTRKKEIDDDLRTKSFS